MAHRQSRNLGPGFRCDRMIAGDVIRHTVVSLTPLALDRDSRAFRMTQSFAESGFRSNRR
jgi:hypothetical protein